MENKKKVKFPLWAKTLLVLVLSVLTMSIVATLYSANRLRTITRDHYLSKSIELADTLALYVNIDDINDVKNEIDKIYKTIPEEKKVINTDWGSPKWEEYLDNYKTILELPSYNRLLEQISTFHERTSAAYMYLCYADFEAKRYIYLVDDAPIEDRCLPGSLDDFTEQDMSIFENLDEGFKPEITNSETYGYLASVGRPIFDSNHNLVAFSLVDLSMDEIVAEENITIRTLTIILLSVGVGATIIAYLLVLFLIIKPVRILTTTANEFTKGDNDKLMKFSQIKINTRDEIEDLANSMKKMEEDINHYISDLLSTTTKLEGAERKADELKYIADRDALTGLMNKRSYFEKEEQLNKKIKDGNAKFAVTMIDLNDLKITNDNLGHEKGDILIKAISSIAKKVFALSSVYRVGGDEFVVISESEDYQNIKKLRTLFLTVIEQTSDDVIKLSASIGTAKYNPNEDNNVEDVFKRADAEMYKMKKAMKEKR